MKFNVFLGCVIFALLSLSVKAEGLDYQITLGTSFKTYVSNEPEGKTSKESTVVPIFITYDLMLDRVTKISVTYTPLDFDITAGINGFGLTVDGYQIMSSYQKKIRFSRSIKPWLSIGLITNFLDFTQRHTTDEQGFLNELFDDRSEISYSLSLSASMDWEIKRDWFINTNINYERAISDGLEGFGLSIGIKYKF